MGQSTRRSGAVFPSGSGKEPQNTWSMVNKGSLLSTFGAIQMTCCLKYSSIIRPIEANTSTGWTTRPRRPIFVVSVGSEVSKIPPLVNNMAHSFRKFPSSRPHDERHVLGTEMLEVPLTESLAVQGSRDATEMLQKPLSGQNSETPIPPLRTAKKTSGQPCMFGNLTSTSLSGLSGEAWLRAIAANMKHMLELVRSADKTDH